MEASFSPSGECVIGCVGGQVVTWTTTGLSSSGGCSTPRGALPCGAAGSTVVAAEACGIQYPDRSWPPPRRLLLAWNRSAHLVAVAAEGAATAGGGGVALPILLCGSTGS